MRTKAIMMSLLLMLIGTATGWAQSGQLTIEDFREDPSATDARTGQYALPYKGKNCAIIKINNPNTGFKFDLGQGGKVQKTEVIDGQTWVWVPAGTRMIKITHKDLGQLVSENGDGYHEFQAPLKTAMVYIMDLGSGTVERIVRRSAGQQFLEFHVTPKDALLEVDGNLWDLNADGMHAKSVSLGTHQFKVTHPDYNPEQGSVDVKDKEKSVMNIELKPHYGYMEVLAGSDDMNGADVILDGQRVGKVPYKNNKLSSTTHTLRISKNLYKTSEEIEFVIVDGQKYTHTAQLEPNFATTKIVVDGDLEADIYINGEKRATGVFDGPLEKGSYNVEARKEHHYTTQIVVDVDDSGEKKSFALPKPVPKLGHLSVKTEPSGCNVYVDGKIMSQQTNCILSDLLEGTRNIRIEKTGYATIEKSVEIKENETVSMDEILNSRLHVDVKVNHYTYDYLMVNGKKYSHSESKDGLNLEVGKYNIWAYDRKYGFGPDRKSKPKTYNVNSNNHVVNINMKKIYVKRSNFYFDGIFQVGSTNEIGGGFGLTIKGVNFEGGYTTLDLLSSLPDVYWYKPNMDWTDYASFPTSCFYGKLGYSVRATNRLILTPQVGMRACLLEGDITTYATSLTFGMRCGYVLCYGIQFFLTPEYLSPNREGPTFKRMAEYIQDYRNLNDGFNLKMGISFVFNTGKK